MTLSQAELPPVQTVVFTSFFDYKKCGGYSFTLNNSRLVVSGPMESQYPLEEAQNYYDLAKIPVNQWCRLKNFRGVLLPVYIHWNNIILQARTGSPPQGRLSILTVKHYSIEWQFEPQANALYKHPEGYFSLRYTQEYPWTPWYIEISTLQETWNFFIESLPDCLWFKLHYSKEEVFPLKILRNQSEIKMIWLPLKS